jgi:hypothetical protein
LCVFVVLLCQVPAVPDAGLAVIEEQLEAVAELQEEVAGCFTAQVRHHRLIACHFRRELE